MLPQKQYAVQLVGPNNLIVNTSKDVFRPGPYQVLCMVEAVGLCFSDLKLLKQFSSHVRKGPVLSGIDSRILDEIPSYVPGDKPTVPGHEAVVRIEAVGTKVKRCNPGQRFLVQTDYRWLRTAGANAAFGYNFEGALQQYVLMDERIITTPDGESMLVPVSEDLSAAAVAMVEPWACVENGYATVERRSLSTTGRTLFVAERQPDVSMLSHFLNRFGRPARISWLSRFPPPQGLSEGIKIVSGISQTDDATFDDIVYFGSNAQTAEELFAKLVPAGLFNIVLCGGRFTRDVLTMVGKIHYEGIRIIGSVGFDPAASMACIPHTGEIRPGDRVHVVGAAGPMGMMHVIRALCLGLGDITVFADDIDKDRLARLSDVAVPLAQKNKLRYVTSDNSRPDIPGKIDYTVVMVPIPDLVAGAVGSAAPGGIIHIFAGIPAAVSVRIDLNSYIEKKLYFVGTSGSVLDDMKRVLAKLQSAALDTNISVAAVCGLESVPKAIHAVENRSIAGKIVAYPSCRGLGLLTLEELAETLPQVAQHLADNRWNKKAEDMLLAAFDKPTKYGRMASD